MRLNVIIWFSVFALSSTLIACDSPKNPSPSDPRFRVTKVTMKGDQQALTDTYSYNSDGRLATIYKAYTDRRKTSNRDYYYTSVLHYDGQGRLTSFENQPDYTAAGTVYPALYTYEYDAKGNVSLINYALNSPDSSNNRFSETKFYLTYDNANRLIKLKSINDIFQDGIIYEYTYDKGIIVKIDKSTQDNTGRISLAYTRTYQFDDKPNPFYGLYTGAPDPDMFTDYSYKLNTFYQNNTLTKNNILFPNLTYEYDSYGNLVKVVGVNIITYEYERY